MHTSTILIIAATATAAVASPAAPVVGSSPVVNTEGNSMHGSAKVSLWGIGPGNVVYEEPALAPAAEEETEEQYRRKLVKMDAARDHGVVCTIL